MKKTGLRERMAADMELGTALLTLGFLLWCVLRVFIHITDHIGPGRLNGSLIVFAALILLEFFFALPVGHEIKTIARKLDELRGRTAGAAVRTVIRDAEGNILLDTEDEEEARRFLEAK